MIKLEGIEIQKLKRTIYGSRSERTARLLLDQMELQLEELEASATEDETTAEMAAAKPPKSPRAARANLSASIYPANG